MKKFYDTTRYDCYICGHKWIIRSDRLITDNQFIQWIKDFIKEHILIHKEKNNNV